MVKLLIADQLKNNLAKSALRYVTLLEGEGWKGAPALAGLLQTFEGAEGRDCTTVARFGDFSPYWLLLAAPGTRKF